MEAPALPRPTAAYLRQKREEHRGAAPQQAVMQRNGYDPNPEPIKKFGDLHLDELDDEKFLANGKDAGWWNDLISYPRDICYAFCYPCPMCCPTRNLACSLAFNMCCGVQACSDVGWRFMWHPEFCPLGCCTPCLPCTGLGENGDQGVCDVACICCNVSPMARQQSFTYWLQRGASAGSEDSAAGCCAKFFRPKPVPYPWPHLPPDRWPPQYSESSHCSMQLFSCCCQLFPLPFGDKYDNVAQWQPPYGGGFPCSCAKEYDPNGLASTAEALADVATSIPCLFRCCVTYQQGCCGLFGGRTGFAPNTTYMPANMAVGESDQQMNDARDCGGYWAFPKSFTNCNGETVCGKLPTPPNTRFKDKDGNEFAPNTNVAPGAPGSKVIFWAHGSAWFAGQSADFLYFFGLFLSEQTGQTVLIGEYPLASEPRFCSKQGGFFFAEALNRWVRTYVKLVELYGAENVVVAGDSAGAGLALATLLDVRCYLKPSFPGIELPDYLIPGMPAGLLLISPFALLSDSSWDPAKFPSMEKQAPKNVNLGKHPEEFGLYDYLPYPNGYTYVPVIYASKYERNRLDENLASPTLATPDQFHKLFHMTGLKVFVNYGDQEILKDQDKLLCDKLRQAAGWGSNQVTVKITANPHDLPCVGGLAALQNVSFGPANKPGHSSVCKAWHEVLSWLAEDKGKGGLGWDKTIGSWSALKDWKPVCAAPPPQC